jgi:hypothetical protein
LFDGERNGQLAHAVDTVKRPVGLYRGPLWLYDRFKPVHDARFESSPLHVISFGDFVDGVRERRP